MLDDTDETDTDSLEVKDEPKSSARLLAAIKKAERQFNAWQGLCDTIDDIYSKSEFEDANWRDPDYDLFWASMEILKPAVYARPPKPVVSPLFKDRRPVPNTTAELLERAVTSDFYRNGLDEAMYCTRDDLIFYNRGQLWCVYETDEKGGGQRVCVEHADRKDFLHGLARKWSEVPWVSKRSWLTRNELRKRFKKASGDAYMKATLSSGEGEEKENKGKAGVWEVWHKADNKVYWVAEGVEVILDENEPHLKLQGFFPCPKPAYGTLKPRTLLPVPDYVRYAGHFTKINQLTRRIYTLLDCVKLKVLIPAGGDIGNAVEQAVREQDDTIFIPVPAAALTASGQSNVMVHLPIKEVAETIVGLIEARRELFSDYDRLSGISDIMRGETEADETLGAQQLKSQYGSVRIRDKVTELQRIARDVTQIAAEIMAENFSQDTLLDMSQMDIPTKAEIAAKVNEIESDAKEELKSLAERAKQMATQAQQQGQQVNPQQAEQQFQQAQQQVISKYGPMLKQASDQVSIEDVMKLLRDDRARSFAFEIETDSTVLTDELQEKASRGEFLEVFTKAATGLTSFVTMGPAAAKLAGEVFKFALQPYRVGRSLNSVIDDFIDAAPQMAAAMAQGGDDDANKAMAEANNKLAEAELQKAQAAIAKVQADAQGKMQDMQLKAAEAQQGAAEREAKLKLELGGLQAKVDLTDAQIQKIMAEIQKMGIDAQNDNRTQDREDFKVASDVQLRSTDQAMTAQNSERDAVFRAQEAARADRGEDRADRQQDYSERSGDRQQALAERQAAKETA